MRSLSKTYPFFLRVRDFLSILNGLWFFILVNLIAFIAFFVAPQGTDILLAITENTGSLKNSEYGTLISNAVWLIIAIIFWSIVAEFSSRIIIYISDNSGRSLAPNRVDSRKRFQRQVTYIALFFPVFILFISFLKAFLVNMSDLKETGDLAKVGIGFAIVSFLHVLVVLFLRFLYVKGGIKLVVREFKSLRFLIIAPIEKKWASKLYGIFSDIRVDVPVLGHTYTGIDLPRGVLLPNGTVLPKSNSIIPFDDNPQHPDVKNATWMFKVKIGFYQTILRQIIVLSVVAIILIVIFGFLLSVKNATQVGAVALFCFAFGCWQTVYMAIYFIDRAQQKFPVRLFLLLLFLCCAVWKGGHPVRRMSEEENLEKVFSAGRDNRPMLRSHFDSWFAKLERESNIKIADGKQSYTPVIFVAAEGGALRTGAFSAMLLAELQGKFGVFDKYVYCYSGVSGGALGTNFYNAISLDVRGASHSVIATEQFFSADFLAPVTAKLAFGEILGLFYPFYIKKVDRGIALEKAWEYKWEEIFGSGYPNLMASDFSHTLKSGASAIFINSTNVETGLQHVWSNVNLQGLPLGKERDLLGRSGYKLAYSSAINLSTRFPIVSPSALFYEGQNKRHFVDGGYYENKGAETLLQVMQAIDLKRHKIKPYVIQISFGIPEEIKSANKLNEISNIIYGIYNTRGARGVVQDTALHNYVRSFHGEYINLALENDKRKVPMDWVLSTQAVNRIKTSISKLINIEQVPNGTKDAADKNELRKLFFYGNK